jgi:hypothetical protein
VPGNSAPTCTGRCNCIFRVADDPVMAATAATPSTANLHDLDCRVDTRSESQPGPCLRDYLCPHLNIRALNVDSLSWTTSVQASLPLVHGLFELGTLTLARALCNCHHQVRA